MCTLVADRPLGLKSDLTAPVSHTTTSTVTHPLITQQQILQLTGKLSISGLTGWKHKDTHGCMSEPS